MTTTSKNPLDKVAFGGRTTDRKTAAALSVVEKRLGYNLTLAQGSYNPGGVGASGGTHDRGGVVDLAPFDHVNKVRELRKVGFAAWYRPAIKGLWGAHIHAVLMNHQDLSPSAANQVVAYRAGKDGLKGNRDDPNNFRPNVQPFSYAAWVADGNKRERISNLKARRARLLDQISATRARITYK